MVYSTSKFEPVQRIAKMKCAQKASGTGTVTPDMQNPQTAQSKAPKDLKIFLDTGMVE